jgi:hypothetical protein
VELQEAVGGLHARGPQQSSFYVTSNAWGRGGSASKQARARSGTLPRWCMHGVSPANGAGGDGAVRVRGQHAMGVSFKTLGARATSEGVASGASRLGRAWTARCSGRHAASHVGAVRCAIAWERGVAS